MYRYRKSILLLFGGVVLCMTTGCFAVAVQQSAEPVNRPDGSRTPATVPSPFIRAEPVNRPDGYTSNLPIVIIQTFGNRFLMTPKFLHR